MSAVNVWLLGGRADGACLERLRELFLDDADRRIVSSIRDTAVQVRFVLGRGLCKLAYMAARGTRTVPVVSSLPGEKPVLCGEAGPLSFSLSHDGDAVGVAWCVGDVPVGFDIVFLRGFDALSELRPGFGPSEWSQLHAHRTALAVAWSMKEALMKREGIGLHRVDPCDLELLDCSQLVALCSRMHREHALQVSHGAVVSSTLVCGFERRLSACPFNLQAGEFHVLFSGEFVASVCTTGPVALLTRTFSPPQLLEMADSLF